MIIGKRRVVNAMPIPSIGLVYYISYIWLFFMVKYYGTWVYMDCVWDDNAINACSHPESQTCSPALEPT